MTSTAVYNWETVSTFVLAFLNAQVVARTAIMKFVTVIVQMKTRTTYSGYSRLKSVISTSNFDC